MTFDLSTYAPHQVDLWIVAADSLDPAMVQACEALLSPQERARYDQFLCAKARHLHLVARALVRTTLSRYQPVPPDAWRFGEGAQGRPHITSPKGEALHFNLSHSGSYVVLAVAAHPAMGVDVERVDAALDFLSLAPTVFALPELAQLHAAPPDRKRDMFFRFWTLKEAYIKATGLGLSMPLDRFWFHLDARGAHIGFAAAVEDVGTDWRFWENRLEDGYRLALALRQSGAPDLAVTIRHVAPIAGYSMS